MKQVDNMLLKAAAAGDVPALRAALQAGANVNAVGEEWCTALMLVSSHSEA